MTASNRLLVFAFTDPVCTWCWGSEPILRKLQVCYGERLEISYVMGGLVADIRAFYDPANDIGGDPERSNEQVARHWLEASQRHGMPVRTEGFRLFSQQAVSTFPQNIAVKAAELSSPELASMFLRRLREASAAQARETGRQEVLLEIAEEVGVDVESFRRHLDDGSANEAFQADRELAQQYGVRGFPSFVLRYQGREMLLQGYQRYSAFERKIGELTGGTLSGEVPAATPQNILKFLRQYGRAAPVEIETVFELSPAECEEVIDELSAQGQVRRISAGNGVLVEGKL
ncbi:DsbA family oxidoreductase [Halorhodospira halochloris]|uniref:DsbA family oxidoreductase n=1 Tax=Halorhodospira halochloris TaxID=1052 RepID=UPI001EE7FB50|nr:DsbA family protein [Halorhodospira halochloris]MCG5548018.1 DsbA family protein [Halorhodospira halochloris]